jgi:hypothetical protein
MLRPVRSFLRTNRPLALVRTAAVVSLAASSLVSCGETPRPTGAHPLYPALDLDTLPGEGGAASGPYEVPELPRTTREVTANSREELEAACTTGPAHVTVPGSAGHLGVVNLGGYDDCDVELGAEVTLDWLVIGSLRGPMRAPVHRLRVRGGQLGGVYIDEGSTDVVLDGVIIDNAVAPEGARQNTAIQVLAIDRFAVINSMIRMVPIDAGGGVLDGCAYLGVGARNVMFANDNVATAGNRNSWGFRIGGGENYLFVDLSVRVSFHKLIRMNDGPVDYVVVRGGTWMREATRTVDGLELNDAFAQVGGTLDQVHIEDTDVYLLGSTPVAYGMLNVPDQAGRSWKTVGLHWHARSAEAVSDTLLAEYARLCPSGATCDSGVGTNTYDYDPGLTFPSSPWRPGVPTPDSR